MLKPFYIKKKNIDDRLISENGALPYITTAPDSDNDDGIIIVVLSAEPEEYHEGYLYIITES